MQRVLPFLMIVAVFWCSVHSLVADHAIADIGNEACAELVAPSEKSQEAPAGPSKSDHVGHHHCPVAPDRQMGVSESAISLAGELHFNPPAVVLRSHSQAPPLQPPAA